MTKSWIEALIHDFPNLTLAEVEGSREGNVIMTLLVEK